MIGRPERVQTNVRLVRRAQPRATRSRALPLAVTIVVITVFVAAWFTRATGSGAALIGSWDPPVASTPDRGPDDGGSPTSVDAPSPGSAGHSAKGTSSAPLATSVALLSSSSPTATMPQLPACRDADEPAAHAAYDDWQRTIVDTTSRLPKGYVPPDLVAVSRAGLSGGGSIRLIAIADLKALAVAARKAGVRLAVESAYRSEARQQQDVRGLGTHLRRSRGQTFQCARRTLGAPARDRHRFQGRGRRVPVDASIRALAACAMAGGERLAIRLDPELSAGRGDTDLLRRLRPGTTATSDGTSPPRSTRRA